MSRPVAPPTPQEVSRKLSIHPIVRSSSSSKKPLGSPVPVSGTESDSDSVFSPDAVGSPQHLPVSILASSSSQPPLSSIAERRSGSGEESEEDEDEDDADWGAGAGKDSFDETVIKSGYLWKKGERRKTWKKRWFVLRPAHLAFYKTAAEYKLLRLLDLAEIHSVTPVELKKHAHTFGIVAPARTFYLQAGSAADVQAWVLAINETRIALLGATTPSTVAASTPIPIPRTPGATTSTSTAAAPRPSPSPSRSPYAHGLTSSESEDASPAPPHAQIALAGGGEGGSVGRAAGGGKDAGKSILTGYLMKCGSRRHIWRNRWFVLSGEKLVYSRSHMDTKPHREIQLSQILDALEYELPAHHRHHAAGNPAVGSPPHASSAAAEEADGAEGTHTFKVVTTKRTLLLCAPSEEEEIRWLSAVRALIARRSGVAGETVGGTLSPAKSGGVGGDAGGVLLAAGGMRRRDSAAQKPSVSVVAPGAGEGASERQS